MPYDESFYRRYREYLEEPVVRRNHDHIFKLFANLVLPEKLKVMDLGCGIGEYHIYDLRHSAYIGVDRKDTGNIPNFVEADYTAPDFNRHLPFTPNAFLSSFSIECCYLASAKYTIYNKLFWAFPCIRYGLAGGFFYESKRNQETVLETGDIVSYQTIEDPSLYISETFTELRAHLRTPSKMFGEDVVEVWKFFVRK